MFKRRKKSMNLKPAKIIVGERAKLYADGKEINL